MKLSRFWIVLTIVLAITLSACGQAAAPAAPTAAPQAKVVTTAPAPTVASAAAPTVAPTAAPTKAPAAQPKPSPTVAPAPTKATSGVGDLIAKASSLGDYTYDFKIDLGGMATSGKAYVKGTKMRQEIDMGGIKAATLIDSSAKVAYTLMPDQKIAMKMDFSKVQGGGSPTDEVTGMPADSKVTGMDSVDGKSATVYEYSKDGTTAKMWIWTEKGVPLKAEVNSDVLKNKVTMEFMNYQFAPQDASLFEVPKDFEVTDMSAGGIPGGSGQIPVPPVKP